MADKKTFKVKLNKSLIGRLDNHISCARGLGLKKIGQIREVEDTPSNRGMANKVSYMVEIIED
ncbi:MAG: 50S ribosomal protein L30 [Pseudomonadota bacterium]|nr:50S ribosomal protein L30 [Pseudomonadota bacterium]